MNEIVRAKISNVLCPGCENQLMVFADKHGLICAYRTCKYYEHVFEIPTVELRHLGHVYDLKDVDHG